ncbi:putative uncharacterized protein DDB_G0287113 isoform X2 [Metopolophium dirhodum]|uniref:putative uncharacterized protein DDB_G0287113 isoform X2 n=1 Tax=Metopolophium dirhodum TaxID=44670 RepID=UPI00298FC5B3|nr:putative uncharacterized protein DDB_G0287113 isoform X2 [Metopolophium dirhodum]
MFAISVVLSVSLSSIFADAFLSSNYEGNPRFVPQPEPSTTQGVQYYVPNMPQSSMEGNQPIYPLPQQSMMQLPMVQGFQSPFSMNLTNQQQLSLLMISMYAKMMALTQLMNMQNRYQLYQPNQYYAVNNYGPTPAPLPYVQQPQVDLQNNLQNEMLQQQQQAESQQKEILEQRRVQREYDMEVERRGALIKRQAEEEELEKQQQVIEYQLRDEEEIRRGIEEAEKQILEEQQKEMEQKENDLKLRQGVELRFQKIKEEKKMKKNQENQGNQENMKSKVRLTKKQRKPIVSSTN